MIRALDVSFGAPKVTPSWCRDRLSEGYGLLIADLWTGKDQVAGAESALKTWREAGGITAAYFVVHDGRSAQQHFTQARANAGDEWAKLSFVSVDVEIDPTSVETVQAACDLVRQDGLRPIVYSRLGFWKDQVGNSTALKDLPLWDARYGVDPALVAPGYGGWKKRTGHQYQNTTDVGGIDVDVSVFDDEFVAAVSPGPTITAELDRIWAALDAAEHATTDPNLQQQLEDAKQFGVVSIKKKLGLP